MLSAVFRGCHLGQYSNGQREEGGEKQAVSPSCEGLDHATAVVDSH